MARVEDPRLVTGKGVFVDDISRPGMLHARFVRSPFARARIESIDTTAARQAPGVRAVFTAADLNPDVHELWFTAWGPDVPDAPRPPLAEDEVRFVGDPVALVIADDRYLAEDATELVEVEYEPLEPVADYAVASESDHEVWPGWANNTSGHMPGRPVEDLQPILDEAAVVVAPTIRQQSYAAAPIEPRGIVVEWDAASEELTVWASTQTPHDVKMFAARLLGLPEHSVRVIARDTGGGFGQKINPHREDFCLLLAARKVPGPVKFVEDRRENLMASQSRHGHGTATMAFDADGTLLASAIEHVQDVGAYPIPWPVGSGTAVGLVVPRPVSGERVWIRLSVRVLQHTWPHRLPRAVAVRDPRPRDDPRHGCPAPRDRSGGRATAQPAAA